MRYVGLFAFLSLSVVFILSHRNRKKTEGEMYAQICILSKWVDNLIRGKTIEAFLSMNNIQNIIIVGFDVLAEKLINELFESPIEIVCVVDDRYADKMQYIPGIDFITHDQFSKMMNDEKKSYDAIITLQEKSKYEFEYDSEIRVFPIESIISVLGSL